MCYEDLVKVQTYKLLNWALSIAWAILQRGINKKYSLEVERELQQVLQSVDTSALNPNTHQISPLFGKIMCIGNKIPIKHMDFSSVYEYSSLCCNLFLEH